MPDPKHERTHRLIDKLVPIRLLPTEEDLQRVDEMNPCDCPRRYCWHWKTQSLEWDMPVSACCQAHFRGVNHKGDPIPAMHDTPCKRLDPSSPKDHFEPREPAMLEDGIPEGRWDCGDFKQRRSSGPDSSYPDVINWNGTPYYISNRTNFLKFLEAFQRDIASSEPPIENKTLSEFLEAMNAWTDDVDKSDMFSPGNYSRFMDRNPWAAIAAMLVAASMYE